MSRTGDTADVVGHTVENVLVACRAEGLGYVLTTILCAGMISKDLVEIGRPRTHLAEQLARIDGRWKFVATTTNAGS